MEDRRVNTGTTSAYTELSTAESGLSCDAFVIFDGKRLLQS
jgi:hypothetical protein